MSESSSEDEFDPKYFFPNFRSEISTESESQAATVVGFDKEELLFTPIIGGHLNFTSTEDDDYPSRQNEVDVDNSDDDVIPSDIYLTLVIVSVSLVVLVLLSYALYKAIVMLKVSLNDGRDDSMPVPGGRRATSASTTNTTSVTSSTSSVTSTSLPVSRSSTNVSHLASNGNGSANRSGNGNVILSTATMPSHSPPRRHISLVTQAQNSFIQGIRNFHPPMFTSTLTRRHEDDQPPPYDEPSPPPYHIAIQMRPNSSNFEDGFKLDPIKISQSTTTGSNRAGDFDSISLESGDVTDGIKKYVSVAIVV